MDPDPAKNVQSPIFLDIELLLESTNDIEHQKAIWKAALAAPSIKLISASKEFVPAECLKILQDRKDWEIRTN